MSILIKGIEMPRSCRECPLEDAYEGYNCRMTEKAYNWGLSGRPSDCPLVEIPRHGRLIDADALDIYRREEKAQEDIDKSPFSEYLEGLKDGLHEAAKCLSTAPTIIEAEPCNDLAKPNNTIFAVQNADEDERLFEAKPIDYMHTPSVEEIIEADGLDSFIKHFED